MGFWKTVSHKVKEFGSNLGFQAPAVRGVEPGHTSGSLPSLGFLWWLVCELYVVAGVFQGILKKLLLSIKHMFVRAQITKSPLYCERDLGQYRGRVVAFLMDISRRVVGFVVGSVFIIY